MPRGGPNPKLTDHPPDSWWKSYFSRLYGRLYQGPLEAELATAEELALIRRLFAESGPVLDLCCGYGRHLRPLLAEGLDAFGLDYSADLLAMLPAKARRRALRGDMRALPFADGSLGAVCMLFNSFGYFSDEENGAVLGEIARVLRPGGRLLLDAPARTGMRAVVRDTPVSIRSEDGFTMVEQWAFAEGNNRLEARGHWDDEDARQEWGLSLRVYTPAELCRMIQRSGFSGPVEIRPLPDLAETGTGAPPPPHNAPQWRNHSNMILLAER